MHSIEADDVRANSQDSEFEVESVNETDKVQVSSVLKSGPVRCFALQGLRPRPRPVHIFQKRKKTGPRPQKTKDRGLCGFKTGLFLFPFEYYESIDILLYFVTLI